MDLDERSEEAQVEGWRLEELIRAGYPEPLAVKIALEHQVDLHHAVELLKRGCRPEIAARILL
jgi:hypothetical protein